MNERDNRARYYRNKNKNSNMDKLLDNIGMGLLIAFIGLGIVVALCNPASWWIGVVTILAGPYLNRKF